MRAAIFAFLVVVSSFALTGCQNRSLVGKWQMVSDQPIQREIEFGKDGKLRGTVTVVGVSVKMEASFEYKSNQITTGKPNFEGVPPQIESMIPSTLIGAANYQVTWLKDGSIELAGGNLLNGKYRRLPASP